ncbi:MAG: hypothetical protein AAF492_30345 [Verrucomicrobiota bacterium]
MYRIAPVCGKGFFEASFRSGGALAFQQILAALKHQQKRNDQKKSQPGQKCFRQILAASSSEFKGIKGHAAGHEQGVKKGQSASNQVIAVEGWVPCWFRRR